MKRLLPIVLLIGWASGPAMADLSKTWPLKGANESDPRVIEAYQQQCENWAQEQNQQGQDKERFLQGCMENIRLTWTVGFEEDKGE